MPRGGSTCLNRKCPHIAIKSNDVAAMMRFRRDAPLAHQLPRSTNPARRSIDNAIDVERIDLTHDDQCADDTSCGIEYRIEVTGMKHARITSGMCGNAGRGLPGEAAAGRSALVITPPIFITMLPRP